ncbi:uncharacterized protein LOC111269895 isoform X2 [Varroa jacobsoni]|uniref:Uncharacterized protein n=2 Tax=Varroa TaxID=62624 RepID=A0A7M7JIX3_VARDE|nr:uncharacterized protein LOC111246673 [Varroa destructor]XP_022652386.1 uncharacterized protein LOC111246673 [Varroa destructor]XP_022652387.1 uncharacterized protein LOC111246673 [Varroa destructor]XP_022652388.1 uncharacterized protein LOC111246673 [Varroa destructor]XP_022705540.1 uncharacterized protein LOC111269895 isoform X2 [Varroa jacobsoni]
MRNFFQMSVLFAVIMAVIWSQVEIAEAKIVHKVIAGIALPVVAGAGAGLAGGVVAGAVTGAHRDREYNLPSTTYYRTFEHSYLDRARPHPSPLLRHLRKALRYSFEHRRRPQYASWLSAYSPYHYFRPSHTIFQSTHAYQPFYSKSSYHKAVYPPEGSSSRTMSIDAQIECKVVSEDVTSYRKTSMAVPAHEEEAHYLYKPKSQDDKSTRVVHEHHHYHDDEAEIDSEGHDLTNKDAPSHYKDSKKHYHQLDEDSEAQHNSHDHRVKDVSGVEEDSFARRRAIRRKNKQKKFLKSKPHNEWLSRSESDNKQEENRE